MSGQNRARVEYQWRNRGIKRASVLLYEALLVRQGTTCRLCPQRPGRRRLILDYNQATGQIRGLLCPVCSTAVRNLEVFKANKARFDQLMDYIEDNGSSLVTEAEADAAKMSPVALNSIVAQRREAAVPRFGELINSGADKNEAIRQVAAEFGKCARTIRRYLGLP